MFISTLLRGRFIIIAALALVLATAAYGFAAANTVEVTGAGSGAGVISGYDVTNVVYALNATDPTKVDSISFDVAPKDASVGAADFVTFRLAGTGAWISADGTAASPSWTFDFVTDGGGAINVSTIVNLEVVATSASAADLTP
jgi:hypothetical protein